MFTTKCEHCPDRYGPGPQPPGDLCPAIPAAPEGLGWSNARPDEAGARATNSVVDEVALLEEQMALQQEQVEQARITLQASPIQNPNLG
jgi:hypothetical protein